MRPHKFRDKVIPDLYFMIRLLFIIQKKLSECFIEYNFQRISNKIWQ
jgi:hypothetical protein